MFCDNLIWIGVFDPDDELPKIAVPDHGDLTAALADKVVMGNVTAALIDQRFHAHIRDTHLAGGNQPFQCPIDG